MSSSLLIALAVQGRTMPLRVCSTSVCGANGGQALCDALTTLSAGTDLQVVRSGCMSLCRGIVVNGGPLSGRQSLPLKLKTDPLGLEVAAMNSAADLLEDSADRWPRFL